MSWIVDYTRENLDLWEPQAVYGPFRSEATAEGFAFAADAVWKALLAQGEIRYMADGGAVVRNRLRDWFPAVLVVPLGVEAGT